MTSMNDHQTKYIAEFGHQEKGQGELRRKHSLAFLPFPNNQFIQINIKFFIGVR